MIRISEYWKSADHPFITTTIHDPVYRQKPRGQIVDLAVRCVEEWNEKAAGVPPAFWPDFGTITMARGWGGREEVSCDGMPFIHPAAETIEEALDLTPPDENPDIAPAVAMFQEVKRRTGRNDLCFKTPDFQGVLNTAALVVKQDELLMAMYAEPDKVHRFLQRLCDANIAYIRTLLAKAGRLDGNIWPYLWLPHTVGVTTTEDMMPLLSPELYKEFGIPYLKQVSDAFGGVFIHCCGEWGRHARVLAESGVRIVGMEFHHPFTDLDEIQEHLDGLVLLPVLSGLKENSPPLEAFVEDLLARRRGRTRFWFGHNDAWGDSRILPILRRHGMEFDGMVE